MCCDRQKCNPERSEGSLLLRNEGCFVSLNMTFTFCICGGKSVTHPPFISHSAIILTGVFSVLGVFTSCGTDPKTSLLAAELRMQFLEQKGDPLNRLNQVIGLINLIYT